MERRQRPWAAPVRWTRLPACRARSGRALATQCRWYPHHRPPADTPAQAAGLGQLIVSRMVSIVYSNLLHITLAGLAALTVTASVVCPSGAAPADRASTNSASNTIAHTIQASVGAD